MVTYYNKKDLISFGNYLLSKERTDLIMANPSFYEERKKENLLEVDNADFENWKESSKTK